MAGVDLDPAHLRSFLAIVDFGGYHRAADALHLTQPAVSRHIRRLEEQLGEPLFARRGRGVELTPYGERAAAELGEVIAAHDRALARLQRRGDDAGPFVLGVIENLVDPVLPDLLARRPRADRRPAGAAARGPLARAGRAAAARRGRRGDRHRAGDEPGRARARLAAAALVGEPGSRRPGRRPTRSRSSPTTPPCSLRDLALRRLGDLGLQPQLNAESPHLSGVHAAVRNGLGYALLAAGGDGLRRVNRGPLSAPIPSPL